MELYTKAILHELQTAITNGDYSITSYDSYDHTFLGEADKLFSNGITVSFKSDGERRYIELYIPNCGTYDGIGNKYMAEWRDTAVGKFMKKDWRQETKDLLGNIIYHRIVVSMPSGLKYEGIIRDLIEYYSEESAEIQGVLKRKYGDLLIDGHLYSLIKLWDANNTHGSTMSQGNFGAAMDESLKNDESIYSAVTAADESDEPVAEEPACEQLF